MKVFVLPWKFYRTIIGPKNKYITSLKLVTAASSDLEIGAGHTVFFKPFFYLFVQPYSNILSICDKTVTGKESILKARSNHVSSN